MQTGLWPKVLQGDTDAVKTVLSVMKRRAKYLGLGEPEEIRARMDVGLDDVLPALMEALEGHPETRAAAADALTDD